MRPWRIRKLVELARHVEGRLEDRARSRSSARDACHHLGQAVIGLWPENHVDSRLATHDLRPFSLCHATCNGDDHVAARCLSRVLEAAQPPELGIDLLRGLLA